MQSTSPDGQRPRHVLAALVLTAAIAASAVAGLTWRSHQRPALANPTTVRLPAAAKNGAEVARYLHAKGAPLLRFDRAIGTTPAVRPKDGCRALAGRLDHIAGPKVLASSSLAVPDPATRDAAENQLDATLRYLAACRHGNGLGDATRRLTFTSVVFRRILRQEGVS